MAATSRILTAVLFLVIFSNSKGKYQQVEIEIAGKNENEPAKIFSESELRQFDGSDSEKPVYLAVRGVVFDVTEGKDFYGKGAAYNQLAGKDASYAIATWSLEDKDMHHDISSLSDNELKGLDDVFVGTYKKKYPTVGYLQYLIDKHADKVSERLSDEL
ncbi:neudesin-like [Mytilus californianus]|uniref:neudesin-like n=1 Tax=Mytilus californianus TaxID=6549 RepID=UPI002247E21C|nr:neudesin-like [Mytilus californianus]